MGAWPSDDLTSQYLDSGNDDPALARSELYALLQKVQAMLAAHNDNSGICGLDSSGFVPESNHRIQHVPCRIHYQGGLEVGPSNWSCTKTSTGNYKLTHNLGHYQYSVVAMAANGRYVVAGDSMSNDGVDAYLSVRNVVTDTAVDSELAVIVSIYDTNHYAWP